jgi:hypothetical protein
MIAALEPLHEELERVGSHFETLDRSDYLDINFRDPKLPEKRRSSKPLVVNYMRQEKRLVDIRNMAKSKILTMPGTYISL